MQYSFIYNFIYMESLISISIYILIIWWAFVVILSMIAFVYIISILIKVNSIVKDVYEKYIVVSELFFSPVKFILSLINKIK